MREPAACGLLCNNLGNGLALSDGPIAYFYMEILSGLL